MAIKVNHNKMLPETLVRSVRPVLRRCLGRWPGFMAIELLKPPHHKSTDQTLSLSLSSQNQNDEPLIKNISRSDRRRQSLAL